MSSDVRYRRARRSRRYRHDAIYRTLKAELVNCRLRPGQHLSITRLSQSFQSSNTPVREALIRLEAERLVVLDADGGFMVRELSLAEMRQLLEFARLLLIACITGAVDDFRGDQMARPVALRSQSRYRASRILQVQAEETSALIEGIFVGVAEMSDNNEIVAIIRNICDRTHFIRVRDIGEARRGRSLADDLTGILEAIDRNDREGMEIRINSFLQGQIDRLPHVVPKALVAVFMGTETQRSEQSP